MVRRKHLLCRPQRAELCRTLFGNTDRQPERQRDRRKEWQRFSLLYLIPVFLRLAPEIMRKQEYNEKVDNYAFGVVLWEICKDKREREIDRKREGEIEERERERTEENGREQKRDMRTNFPLRYKEILPRYGQHQMDVADRRRDSRGRETSHSLSRTSGKKKSRSDGKTKGEVRRSVFARSEEKRETNERIMKERREDNEREKREREYRRMTKHITEKVDTAEDKENFKKEKKEERSLLVYHFAWYEGPVLLKVCRSVRVQEERDQMYRFLKRGKRGRDIRTEREDWSQ